MENWQIYSGSVAPSPNQADAPAGFTRMRITHPEGHKKHFYRLRATR